MSKTRTEIRGLLRDEDLVGVVGALSVRQLDKQFSEQHGRHDEVARLTREIEEVGHEVKAVFDPLALTLSAFIPQSFVEQRYRGTVDHEDGVLQFVVGDLLTAAVGATLDLGESDDYAAQAFAGAIWRALCRGSMLALTNVNPNLDWTIVGSSFHQFGVSGALWAAREVANMAAPYQELPTTHPDWMPKSALHIAQYSTQWAVARSLGSDPDSLRRAVDRCDAEMRPLVYEHRVPERKRGRRGRGAAKHEHRDHPLVISCVDRIFASGGGCESLEPTGAD